MEGTTGVKCLPEHAVVIALNWLVYIILCSDDSLYTGITTDIERRFAQHLAGAGAKYFRGRSPEQLVYLEAGHDRSSASRREVKIKRLRPAQKQNLISSSENQLKTLLPGTDFKGSGPRSLPG